jgi:hypothetical protein
MEALFSEVLANSLLSISLDGPDEGANGTRNWDISPLAATAAALSGAPPCADCTDET